MPLDIKQKYLLLSQGTTDHTSYLAATAGLSFLRSIGGIETVSAYVGPMLDRAQANLTKAMGTRGLPVPESMIAPFMRVVGE